MGGERFTRRQRMGTKASMWCEGSAGNDKRLESVRGNAAYSFFGLDILQQHAWLYPERTEPRMLWWMGEGRWA